jgi:hypothetical protein
MRTGWPRGRSPAGGARRTAPNRPGPDHRCFAIDREAVRREAPRRGRDGGEAVGVVHCTPRPEPHRCAVAADDQPIAVVLDFVDPLRPRGRPDRLHGLGRKHEPGWELTVDHGCDRAISRTAPAAFSRVCRG